MVHSLSTAVVYIIQKGSRGKFKNHLDSFNAAVNIPSCSYLFRQQEYAKITFQLIIDLCVF